MADPQRPDVAKPHHLPDAIRWFDDATVHEVPREPALHCFELVRVVVPKDHVGVLTGLWQWLASPVGALTGPYDHVRLGPNVLVEWSLVLEDQMLAGDELRHFEGPEAAPPTSRLPPYGAFQDLRFAWGSSIPIRVFAPEHSTVSLWCRLESPQGEIYEVGGRLAGYTQLGRSAAAYENLVRGV